jgi:hypothetical protein
MFKALGHAWRHLKNVTDPKGKALADLTVAGLAYNHSRLGQMEELTSLLIFTRAKVGFLTALLS